MAGSCWIDRGMALCYGVVRPRIGEARFNVCRSADDGDNQPHPDGNHRCRKITCARGHTLKDDGPRKWIVVHRSSTEMLLTRHPKIRTIHILQPLRSELISLGRGTCNHIHRKHGIGRRHNDEDPKGCGMIAQFDGQRSNPLKTKDAVSITASHCGMSGAGGRI